MIRSQIIWSVVAAAVSGLLTSLGFPKDLTTHSAFAWVLPIALIPLLVAIELLPTTYQPPSRTHSTTTRPVTAFTRGLEAFALIWLFGAVLIGFAFHWVTVPAVLFGELTPAVSYSLFLLYCVLAGLYFTIIFFPVIWNAARCSKRSLSQFPVWCLVVTVASLESLLPRIFHWTFGNLMFGSLPVVQWASLIGSSGLSVLVFASNFYLVRALTERPRNPGRLSLVVASVGAGWLCVVFVGNRLLNQTHEMEKNARTTHVGFVQPNFGFEGLPRNKQYSKQLELQSLSSLMKLTEEMVISTDWEKLDLIVWPESAAPYNFGWSESLKREVLQKIQEWNSPLLAQAIEFNKEEAESLGQHNATIYSVSFLLKTDGSQSQSFKKWLPIPFGESIPFEDSFPWLGDLVRNNVRNISKLGRGTTFDALAYTAWDAVAPLICFDAISSDLTRAQSTQGNGTLYVNQANFLWMWKSQAALQFTQLGRFRAIENRRSFILSSNTGPSVAISPSGEFMSTPLPLIHRGYLKAKLPVLEVQTPYARYGNTPLLFLGSIAAATLIFMSRPRIRNSA